MAASEAQEYLEKYRIEIIKGYELVLKWLKENEYHFIEDLEKKNKGHAEPATDKRPRSSTEAVNETDGDQSKPSKRVRTNVEDVDEIDGGHNMPSDLKTIPTFAKLEEWVSRPLISQRLMQKLKSKLNDDGMKDLEKQLEDKKLKKVVYLSTNDIKAIDCNQQLKLYFKHGKSAKFPKLPIELFFEKDKDHVSPIQSETETFPESSLDDDVFSDKIPDDLSSSGYGSSLNSSNASTRLFSESFPKDLHAVQAQNEPYKPTQHDREDCTPLEGITVDRNGSFITEPFQSDSVWNTTDSVVKNEDKIGFSPVSKFVGLETLSQNQCRGPDFSEQKQDLRVYQHKNGSIDQMQHEDKDGTLLEEAMDPLKNISAPSSSTVLTVAADDPTKSEGSKATQETKRAPLTAGHPFPAPIVVADDAMQSEHLITTQGKDYFSSLDKTDTQTQKSNDLKQTESAFCKSPKGGVYTPLEEDVEMQETYSTRNEPFTPRPVPFSQPDDAEVLSQKQYMGSDHSKQTCQNGAIDQMQHEDKECPEFKEAMDTEPVTDEACAAEPLSPSILGVAADDSTQIEEVVLGKVLDGPNFTKEKDDPRPQTQFAKPFQMSYVPKPKVPHLAAGFSSTPLNDSAKAKENVERKKKANNKKLIKLHGLGEQLNRWARAKKNCKTKEDVERVLACISIRNYVEHRENPFFTTDNVWEYKDPENGETRLIITTDEKKCDIVANYQMWVCGIYKAVLIHLEEPDIEYDESFDMKIKTCKRFIFEVLAPALVVFRSIQRRKLCSLIQKF
ncbi:uncharacterized protein [Hoplias malabaricus]|uniref:uncharacterized protein n=1 Tax=Hoplias malabaricus TaxID=27720 RepID=UPI003461F338